MNAMRNLFGGMVAWLSIFKATSKKNGISARMNAWSSKANGKDCPQYLAGLGIPEAQRGIKKASTIHAEELKVGDSMITESKQTAHYIQTKFRKEGKKATMRKIPYKGWKVWRVE